MNQTQKRSYHSKTRDAQAAKTRSLILESAKKLFQQEGFDCVTIDRIAAEAEVSKQTIYTVFKTKRRLLQSLIDEALPEEQFAQLVETSMREKSPRKRLSITARLARQIYDAEQELMDIIRGASVVAPEFKELEQEREKRRYERQGEFVRMMENEKSLAEGLTLDRARDLLWILTGRDLYRMAVAERGWTSDEYEKWLADLLAASLIRAGN